MNWPNFLCSTSIESAMHSPDTGWRLDGICDAAFVFACKRYAGTLVAVPFNPQPVPVFNQLHLRSLSPPVIHLPGGRYPKCSFLPEICQMLKQRLVNLSFSRCPDVIGVHDKTDQPVFFHDEIDLLLPQID